MKRFLLLVMVAAIACCVTATRVSWATDVDGPNDCVKNYTDFGDAPECIPAYPSGVLGKFPTCISTCAVIGTMEIACPPISTPPGPTGFVIHHGLPGGYWLGCYPTPIGPEGVDSETDGKTNTPAIGISACSAIPTDCVETAFGGMKFDQDECYTDGSDAGITAPITFGLCAPSKVTFDVTSCGTQHTQVFLNILVDWNEDGDWNDNFQCPGAAGCAYEWAVKNAPLILTPGCALMSSPLFMSGPFQHHGWLRITISDSPAPDDYPWNGSVSIDGGFVNGETEDYPVEIGQITPNSNHTWGQLKQLYR